MRRVAIGTTTLAFAVLLAAALAGGCLFDGDDEERDRALLQRMRADIEFFVGVPACTDSGACAFVPLGVKPCGGPWRYLIYSKASVDSAALAQKVEAYNQFEGACNRKYGWISDCSTPSPPRLSCEKGVCVDLGPQSSEAASRSPFLPEDTARRVSVAQARASWEEHWARSIDRVLEWQAEHGGLERVIAQVLSRREASRREWSGFLGRMQPADELWFWSSSPESWDWLGGREGYVIVRDGVAVDRYITLLN